MKLFSALSPAKRSHGHRTRTHRTHRSKNTRHSGRSGRTRTRTGR
jgi:hypothetical protein